MKHPLLKLLQKYLFWKNQQNNLVSYILFIANTIFDIFLSFNFESSGLSSNSCHRRNPHVFVLWNWKFCAFSMTILIYCCHNIFYIFYSFWRSTLKLKVEHSVLLMWLTQMNQEWLRSYQIWIWCFKIYSCYQPIKGVINVNGLQHVVYIENCDGVLR